MRARHTILVPFVALLAVCGHIRVAYASSPDRESAPSSANKYITDYQDLVHALQQLPDHLAMVMLVRSDAPPDAATCERCEHARTLYANFTSLTQNLIHSFVVDCHQVWKKAHQRVHLPACDPALSDKLPVITFIVPPAQEANPFKRQPARAREVVYKGDLDTQSVLAHAFAFMPYFHANVTRESDLEDFVQRDAHTLKVVYVGEDDAPPAHVKALTSYYRQRIDFAHVRLSAEHAELADACAHRLNVTLGRTHLPKLVALKYKPDSGTHELIAYNGALRFDSLRAFFDRFALRDRKRAHYSQYEEILDTSVKSVTLEGLQEAVFGGAQHEERWVAVHLVAGGKAHAAFSRVKRVFGALFEYYEIQVPAGDQSAQKDAVEDALHVRQWPSLLIYPQGAKKATAYVPVSVSDSDTALARELLQYVAKSERLIDDLSVRELLQDSARDSVYTLVWFYAQSDLVSQLVAHTFSNTEKFKQCFKFARYPDPDANSGKFWELPRVPHAIALLGQASSSSGVNRADLAQNDFSFENVWNFLSQLCFEREKNAIADRSVKDGNTQDAFSEHCLLSRKACVVALLDTTGTPSGGRLALDLDLFAKARDAYTQRDLAWVWVDAICHPEVTRKLDLRAQDLPLVVYYDHARARYKALTGEAFTVRNIVTFLKGLEKRKRGFVSLDEELDLDDRDCAKARESAQRVRYQDL